MPCQISGSVSTRCAEKKRDWSLTGARAGSMLILNGSGDRPVSRDRQSRCSRICPPILVPNRLLLEQRRDKAAVGSRHGLKCNSVDQALLYRRRDPRSFVSANFRAKKRFSLFFLVSASPDQ